MSKKTKTKRPASSQRTYRDGWYMLTLAFDPQKAIQGKIDEQEFIVQGGAFGAMFVQVPPTMDAATRDKLGNALAQQGVNAIVVSSDVKFARLARLRPRDEDFIREQIKKARAQSNPTAPADGADPGPGPFVDGDGSLRARPSDEEDPAREHAEHEDEEGGESPHDDS